MGKGKAGMNYLLTGAAGFIGSAICRRLLERGDSVIVIDNLSTGKIENIPQGVRFIRGNDYEPSVLNQLNDERFDAIIHIAGQSSGEVSFDNPVYDLQTNTQSTLMLLSYAREHDCRKFIFASSMAVYGDAKDGYCREDMAPLPKSFYAVGKLASENYMRIYSREYGITCTALRFFNVYGEGQNMDNMRQGMASIYLAMALKDQHIRVKGSKDRYRDFVYIDDVVNAVMKSLDRKEGYEFFNVCTGKKTTVEEVIQVICEELYPIKIDVTYLDGTPGDQFGTYGDYLKIKNAMKWEPQTAFVDGMKKMILWAKAQ